MSGDRLADGSLQRLLLARDQVDADWRDFLLQVAPDGQGPIEARPATQKVRGVSWSKTNPKGTFGSLRAGGSVLVGFWDDATQFASPSDGVLTAVPRDAWFVDRDSAPDDELEAEEIFPGNYGDLLADPHHVIFDRHGWAELWHPGSFQVTRDQRSFRRKTAKGHAVDDRNDVKVRSVLNDLNLAHRFATEGYLVVEGSSAMGLIIGSSLQDWHRANRR